MMKIAAKADLLSLLLGLLLLQVSCASDNELRQGYFRQNNLRKERAISATTAQNERRLANHGRRVASQDSFDAEMAAMEGSGDSADNAMMDSGDPMGYYDSPDSGDAMEEPASPDEPMVPEGPDGPDGPAPPTNAPVPSGPGIVTVNVTLVYASEGYLTISDIETSFPTDAELPVFSSELKTMMPSDEASMGDFMTDAPSAKRRRLEEVLTEPAEDEVDVLIENTLIFYNNLYTDAFAETILEVSPTSVFTEPLSEGLFLLNFNADLAFSSLPPLNEVISVSTNFDTEEYIEMFVQPSGPYFADTIFVEPTAEAQAEAAPTERPTSMPTMTPTMSPTMAMTEMATEAVVETSMPSGMPAVDTDSPTMAVVTDTPAMTPTMMAMTTGAPTTMETMEATSSPTAATTVVETTLIPTGSPTMMMLEDTSSPTITPTLMAATESPTEDEPIVEETAAPTEGEVPETSAPTEGEVPETPAPTASETPAETACPGRTARVVGEISLELDSTQDLMDPTEDQVIEVAQYILQEFGVILRDVYGDEIRGFSATIDETDTDLVGNTYPLGFNATILFSPCAPSTEETNGIFADADYESILSSFEPTGEDNVFQYLTGSAEYTGEATIEP